MDIGVIVDGEQGKVAEGHGRVRVVIGGEQDEGAGGEA